jgi:hypothetical protein
MFTSSAIRSIGIAGALAGVLTVSAVPVITASPAYAQGRDWHGGYRAPPPRGGWHGGGGYGGYHGGGYNNGGAIVGGALLGLGVGAAIGALAQPPVVVYAPPPAYYPPPPPVYYGY